LRRSDVGPAGAAAEKESLAALRDAALFKMM
jgi:hypothetical protein